MSLSTFLQSVSVLIGGLTVIYLVCKIVGKVFLREKNKNGNN